MKKQGRQQKVTPRTTRKLLAVKKNSAERGKEIHEQPWQIVLVRQIEIYDTLPAFVLKILDFQLLSISLFLTAGLHCPIKTLEQKVKSSSPTDGAYYLTQ